MLWLVPGLAGFNDAISDRRAELRSSSYGLSRRAPATSVAPAAAYRLGLRRHEQTDAGTLSMKPRFTSAIWALLITAISVAGSFLEIGFASPGRYLAHLASLPALPGAWAVAFLGLGHGPEGFPTQADVLPYLLTFLLWWGGIHGARVWWARGRTRGGRGRTRRA